jgi:hypothetical protein
MLDNTPDPLKLCQSKIKLCLEQCNRTHAYRIQTGPGGDNVYQIKNKRSANWKLTDLTKVRVLAHQNMLCGRKCATNTPCVVFLRANAKLATPSCSKTVKQCQPSHCPKSSLFFLRGKPITSKNYKNIMKKGLRIQEKHQKAVSKLKGAAQIMSPELLQKPQLKNLAGLSKKSVAHTVGKMEEAKEKLKKAKNRADRKALNKKVIKGVERRVKGKKAREAANAAKVAAKSVETTLKAEHKAKNFVKHQLISATAKYQQARAHRLQKKLKEHKLLKLEAKNAIAKSIINRSDEEKAIKSSAKKA